MRVWLFDHWKPIAISVTTVVGLTLVTVSWGVCIVNWFKGNVVLGAGIIGAGVVLVGWIWAWRTLEAMRRQRSSEIIKNLWEYWDSGVVSEGRRLNREILNKQANLRNTIEFYEKNYPDGFSKLISVPNFFELVGWLVKNKCVPLSKTLDFLRSPITGYYEDYQEYITAERQKQKDKGEKPSNYDYFIWLANKAKKK